MLDFHVKTRIRFSLRDKRLFEITEVEITRVDCIVMFPKEKKETWPQLAGNACILRRRLLLSVVVVCVCVGGGGGGVGRAEGMKTMKLIFS